jgi:hypothetical protein
MASNARIFFAGIGTSFVILAVGFGAGLILAKSALHDPPLQNRATSEPSPRDKSYFASFRRTDTTNRGGSAGTSA